ncbi:MAG: transcriptional regulator NrdR [uncultured bacterium]|nr:MAG: transcriptional regulator NrdR [uncultured bacterium]HLD44798.1 transcriptional regulator NrdR [bacterium]
MKCPTCQHPESKVIDSRVSNEANNIRRRRECEQCGQRFTTYERIEDFLPMVIKKDGRRQVFDRLKILEGVKKACEKRPVSVEKISELVSQIEKKIFEKDAKEIPSTEIGSLVMDKIKFLDHVAYVRFASVYREFKDINEFMKELQGLLKK